MSDTKSFQLKGSLFTLTALQLLQTNMDSIEEQLASVVEQAPKFFQYAPVVIDLQLMDNDAQSRVDFAALIKALRQHGMIPVGMRGGNTLAQQTVKTLGLAVFNSTKSEEPTQPSATQSEEPTQSSTSQSAGDTRSTQTLVVNKPIRSGQQVYAQGGDLVVTASVSQGAELLADGNIHVYGALRGRALAGVQGNQDSRIFCQRLAAELVSIAGNYIVNEALQQADYNKPHQIYLSAGKLTISPLVY
jgi:septum site-determining protein MinC